MSFFQNAAKVFNKAVTPLLSAPVVGDRLAKSMAVISYTGRRTGKTFSTPVNYQKRDDDSLIIGVMMPDSKTWWRNFYPDPAPITVAIGDTARTGTAVAQRDEKRGVRVKVTFEA
ncbi:nitroreductase/quinone reductase family protein [Gordonia sp. CPCC 205333]|uniref:nitroreductase/quinone reductase family protein n=1 Tax=Gordonia sp. CPCC 205333 TaxID=3140790 RepID=UPI003AF3D68D